MEGETLSMQDIFVFERLGLDDHGHVTGRFRPTGVRPKFYDRLRSSGNALPTSVFETVVEIAAEHPEPAATH